VNQQRRTSDRQGIRLSTGSQLESTAGNITLRGTSVSGEAGILLDSGNINSNSSLGNITLEAEQIDIKGNTTIGGNNTLQLYPITASGNLTLNIQNPTAIQPGFQQITIGRNDGSGATSINGNITFNNPVTLQSPQGNGTINTTQTNITGASNATINLTANGNITTGNITNSGREITITGNTIDTTAGTLDTSSTTGNGGAIALSASSDIKVSAINTNTTSSVNTNNAGTVTLNANTGNITITGNINASANAGSGSNLTFLSPVILTQTLTTLNTSGSSGGGKISFQQKLDGTSSSNPDLTLNTGSADIMFFEAIGSTNLLGNLTLNTTGNAIFSNSGSFISLTANANNTQLGGNITFNGTVDGANNLAINAGNGTTAFNFPVGNSTPIGNGTGAALTLTSNGNTTFQGILKANSGITATGPVIFTNDVTLGLGDTATNLQSNLQLPGISFSAANGATFGNITLTGAAAIASASNPLNFNVTINGNQPLTVNAAAGDISFNSAIGNSNPLSRLQVTGQNITANSTVNATGNINLVGTGNVTLNSAVGNSQPSSSLQVNGQNITANSTINTAGNINLSATEKINLAGNVTTTNSGNLTIANSGNLTIAKNVNLDGAFQQTGIGGVALSGNISTNNQNITFSGPVNLNAPVIFSLGNATIAFNSNLAAGNNPLTLTAGEIDFGGQVSGTNTLVLQPEGETRKTKKQTG